MAEKQARQAEWMKLYTLSKEDQQKLIQEKMKRAIEYMNALKKRETLIESR